MIPKHIILHTAGYKPDADIEEIRRWHTSPDPNDPSKPWSDIGYHYYIRRSGEIQPGRSETTPGAHCTDMDMNSKSLGICFEGHGDYEPFTQKQRNSLVSLFLEIYERWNIPVKEVLGHRETGAPKTCPGKKVDMDDIRKMLAMSLQFQHLPEEKKEDWDSNIEYQEIDDPSEESYWMEFAPQINPDWMEKIDRSKDMSRALELAENLIKRSKWQRRGFMVYNGLVSMAIKWSGVKELENLKVNTSKPQSKKELIMLQDKKWYQSKTIWSAIIIVLITALNAMGLDFANNPEVMNQVWNVAYALAGAFGLYGLRDAIDKQKKE